MTSSVIGTLLVLLGFVFKIFYSVTLNRLIYRHNLSFKKKWYSGYAFSRVDLRKKYQSSDSDKVRSGIRLGLFYEVMQNLFIAAGVLTFLIGLFIE
ncbi:MAG: hypothetical protein AB7O48_06285 [Cyclobacteriaceae bacterium]